jgi:hypothetical protein
LALAQHRHIGLDLGKRAANVGGMPRCLSSSIGVSVMRRARIDALRVGQID